MEKRIYLTIDIECHDISRRNQYIDGIYKGGVCGLQHILDLSKELDIPVNCFVDIPEANVYGDEYIKGIVDLIHSYGQHVYLHLHPDYITGDHSKTFLWEYSKSDKKRILLSGFDQYKKILGHRVEFFRVGRYGADREMYEVLNEMGASIYDLSYCSNCHKMCHIDSKELKTYNGTTKYLNQLILPNTRYLGLKFRKRKVFINFDASDTTFNEFKRVLRQTSLNQLVFTMHSWNFIKKYYFLNKFVSLDRYEERKFRNMVHYAKKHGFIFCDLSSTPPISEDIKDDTIIDLCKGPFEIIQMIGNNFIRFLRIGRLNKKYFIIYSFFFAILFLALISVMFMLVR